MDVRPSSPASRVSRCSSSKTCHGLQPSIAECLLMWHVLLLRSSRLRKESLLLEEEDPAEVEGSCSR